jgi:glycosyltransferase involved in cell wall biosynthesis
MDVSSVETVSASVVIPAFGRPRILRHVLQLIDEQSTDAFEIIVVSDGCCQVIDTVLGMEFRHSCRLYDTGYTDGFGALRARNLGARFAVGELLIFLDADCLAGKNHVAVHLNAFEQGTLQLGPIQYVDPVDWSRVIQTEIRPPFRKAPLRPVNPDQLWWLASHCWTGNVAVPRCEFTDLGGFDERLLGRGGEDVDFGLRFACRFRRIKVVDNLVNHVGPTSGLLTMQGEADSFDTTLISQWIETGRYRHDADDLTVNGGTAYFEEKNKWRSFDDLRSK